VSGFLTAGALAKVVSRTRLAARLNSYCAEDEMSILRALLIVIVVVAVAGLLLGYFGGLRTRDTLSSRAELPQASGTVDRARETGAEIGEKAAIAATKVEETIDEAALTAKIKAKMALDDTVKARAINVTTHGTTVTLSGTVESTAERDRALALARETDGVTKVIDDLHTR
jgi:osmotically-inducible protein OsmY